MTDRPVEVMIARCYLHGGLFEANPYKMTAILVDPQTGRPPDVTEDGIPVTPEPGAVERSVQAYLCVPCCRRVNEMAGHEKIRILDDGAQVIE